MAAVSMASKLSVRGLQCPGLPQRVAHRAAKIPSIARVLRVVAQASSDSNVAEKMASLKKTVSAISSRRFEQLAIVAGNLMLAMPAFAEEEKGKIFDFNLTLPIIAIQFLLLMVALDTIWFKPISQVMDSRDENIRKKLIGVRDNSGELKALQAEAEALIKAARAEAASQMSAMKKELAAELDAKLQAYRARIEKELETALVNLEKQKVETMKNLDSQVAVLSDEIVKKVIPFKA